MSDREVARQELFLGVAQSVGLLGTCDRKAVGALIIKEGRCISWGYNGAPPGLPHCNENRHGWSDEPHRDVLEEWADEQIRLHGCKNATHAEANAIAFAARQGISTDGGTLFVGVSPCETCARLTIAAGIVAVHYREEYRDRSGVELLERAGIAYSLHPSRGTGDHGQPAGLREVPRSDD